MASSKYSADVVQRQHRDGGGEADALGLRDDARQQQVRPGIHPERIEMMLADPGRVIAELVGQDRLLADLGDELIGGAGIVFVVVVAEREIAEFHERGSLGCSPTENYCFRSQYL
ncbi:MAG: hypothetical protein P8Z76_13550 [Alphaproteobacteria bacterium]